MLAGIPYRHDINAFSVAVAIRAGPQAEMAHTAAFIHEHGLTLPDEQMTSRFARAVGTDRRHELIVFYHESAGDRGHRLAEISRDDGLRPEFAALGDSLTRRSLECITVL